MTQVWAVPEDRAARLALARAYPFAFPDHSLLFEGGLARPLDDLAPFVADRTAVLAVGSNQSPEQLARKYAHLPGTVIPLTRQPGGMQAWKIVIPTSNAIPEPRAHEGHEWIYVLSGRMRLVLGNQDWVLGPGEVAAFDTTVPHWFGSTGEEPAEILSIFGRPGEPMTVRTTPALSAPSNKVH